MTTVWQQAENKIKAAVDGVESVVSAEWPKVEAFLSGLVTEELEAAIPIIETAAASVIKDPLQLFTPSSWLPLLEDVLDAAKPALEASAINIAMPALTTAATSVLTAVQTRALAAMTAAVAPVAAQPPSE